ncbi:hypothetical protein CTAM01_05896 [Colletotrichum tamarilloi]|uniref:Uncharacterized protein n=1 Tax=Colletotrichum tamarilloi TaxID=1209934 RepID=A0ABQ9RDT2_9PEZI|nr:uncharacterized protein CTAM01_05896 [Colletotrichum tamarilloi]KAK1501672.1 hypothetical protein CTAM01_05896 [Colletotrichum tamarilloi]
MTSLSIPSQLSQLPNHREREDKVNVQTPGPVAGFSVAASFKLEAELTPPSPPSTHYALHFLTTSPITLYSLFRLPSLPVSFTHCSASATPSSYILIQPTPGHSSQVSSFSLPRYSLSYRHMLRSSSRNPRLLLPTPQFSRPLMLVSPSIATLRH